ncbi:MAG: ABC transporter ATP-binding protein, partial [Sedimenticolaceae bacterium]
MLDVQGLSKTYQSGATRQTILDGLDLKVQQAELVALLGASGCGKTTLLNLLSGIDTPDSGRVLIDGVDAHGKGEPQRTLFRRRHIGFVFQFFNLIPTLTVGENIALPMELIDMDPQRARERMQTLLDQVGLSGMADRYPETLSGGEQQRTAVARALAHRPKILLADEPTGNLDEESGRKVTSLLTGLARDQGTTMVVVTHNRSVAEAAD